MLNYRISTPAGKIRAAIVDGATWLCIKDIYAGLGYESHTGWSWHYTKGDHAERYYRRYSLATGKFCDNPKQRGAITMISIEGMYSILELKAMRENPIARAFHAWLMREYPQGSQPAILKRAPLECQVSMFGRELGR